MLDDLKYIHQKDTADALGIVAHQAEQLRESCMLLGNATFKDIHTIVHVGMGGSAVPAEFAKTWLDPAKPFEIVRDYALPLYVDEHTLLIADSHSGNTEEVVSGLEEGLRRGAQAAIITTGGRLRQIAEDRQLPLIVLSAHMQPRYAAVSNLKAIATVLVSAGLVDAETVYPVAEATATHVEQAIQSWLPTVPTKDNPAKQLAQELLGKSVVIYSGPRLHPAAYKWKISVNENAKQIAWLNQLPEFNHNEFIGWSEQPVAKPYAVIDLRSNLDDERIQKRFEISSRLLSGMRPEPHVVQAKGRTLLEQLMWASAFADFTTIYLALLNGINPTPIDLVEKFKRAMV